MTKPTLSNARWADTGSATVTTPLSGQRDTGFVAGDPADEGLFNALHLQAYRWFEFFDPLFGTNGSFTAPTNEHVTVSGTGRFKHGDMERTLSAVAWVPPAGATPNAGIGTGPIQMASTGATTLYAAIPVNVGERIKSISFSRFGNGSADITNAEVFHTTAAGVDTSIGSTSVTNPAASWADTTIDVTDTTIAAGDSITVMVAINATGLALGNIRVTYDRP